MATWTITGNMQGPNGTDGADGATGPEGPTAVSTDSPNSLTLGTDGKIFYRDRWTSGPPNEDAKITTSADVGIGTASPAEALDVVGNGKFSGLVTARLAAVYNNQTGTSYTLQASDNGKIVTFDNSSAIAVTLPDTLSTNFQCTIIQLGVGVPTVTPDTDTINGDSEGVSPSDRWKAMYLSQYSGSNWVADGVTQLIPILFGVAGTPGAGTGGTARGSLYTSYSASGVGATFDAAGTCDSISFYIAGTSRHFRLWKGTWSGTTFVFDSFTEEVDVTVSSGGLITLTAPADFTAFAVTADTALAFYSNSYSSGVTLARDTTQSPNFSGFNSADPPYSRSLSMNQSTGGVLQFKATGWAS